jgi:hypothetical protein
MIYNQDQIKQIQNPPKPATVKGVATAIVTAVVLLAL